MQHSWNKFLKKTLFCLFAAALSLGICPGMVSAATKTIATIRQYDLDGKPGKDKLVIKGQYDGGNSLVKQLIFYVNGEKAGVQAVPDYPLGDISCKLVRTRARNFFLMVSGTVFEDNSDFVLLSYWNGKFTCVLKADQVIEGKKFILSSNRITYQKGTDTASERFVIHSVDSSESLGEHDSTVFYTIKGHTVAKKSRIYKTKILYQSVLKTARKLPVYPSPLSTRRTFTLKKGDQVKVTRIYDSPKRLRIYVKRLSDGKTGWIEGIQNYVVNPLFVGVELSTE